jgi:hypothetical protein
MVGKNGTVAKDYVERLVTLGCYPNKGAEAADISREVSQKVVLELCDRLRWIKGCCSVKNVGSRNVYFNL